MTETAPSEPLEEVLQLRQQNAELQRTLDEAKQQMASKLAFAELKAEAIRAGIVDLDALRLLDLSAVKVDEANGVHGAAEAIGTFKSRKPYLFPTTSSSPPTRAPQAQPVAQKLATEMTDEEYRTARAILLKQFSL
jgi:hypothetical protein